jgi:hypothetical protein
MIIIKKLNNRIIISHKNGIGDDENTVNVLSQKIIIILVWGDEDNATAIYNESEPHEDSEDYYYFFS